MDEAKAIIEAMRLRCQCRGRQIMAYRKKLHQQVCYRVYTAIPYRESTGFLQGIPCVVFPPLHALAVYRV